MISKKPEMSTLPMQQVVVAATYKEVRPRRVYLIYSMGQTAHDGDTADRGVAIAECLLTKYIFLL